MAANAAVSSGVLAAATDYKGERVLQNDFSIELKQGSITNQRSSGRCWMFAALNTLRYELMHRWDLEDFEFSETYLFFWDAMEKSNTYLENVLATLDEPEMDYSRVIASADLLKLIVENCLKKQLNFVVIKDNPSQNDPAQASRAPSPHDGKMKKALRYIDAHLSDELRLEDVAAHVYLSPYYFSKLFKKYQGIGFNAWVNQQRMASAKELLCHSDWSIASIARNLGFSQTSYFCKVFRQTYQVTPQAFRQQINAGSQTESF